MTRTRQQILDAIEDAEAHGHYAIAAGLIEDLDFYPEEDVPSDVSTKLS
jgi:hypothetical protein